ncbi:MAG: hypothetical protein KGJ97_08100 [Xanthomonadaceae bacterium]|nr:hypothetical protein [Xanthomonadaceae bacterium]MDE3072662.1 hypothetical protein [Pseudomonadota bacterium]
MSRDAAETADQNRRRERGFSPGRSGVLALVLAVHSILLGYLLLPPAPLTWRGPPQMSIADALQVRFELPSTKVRARPAATATRREKAGRHATENHRPARTSIPPNSSLMRATLATPRAGSAATRVPMPQTAMMQAPPGAGYIPDGGAFQQPAAAPFSRQNVRIPDDSHIPHAPRFHMADARMQGLAGVARAIGGLFGATDPDCINLDAWQGMTPAERIAHHVSPAEMQKIADEGQCMDPRQRPHGMN